MNFGGFEQHLPFDYVATVIHEFGHALGFGHEHQNPTESCDAEFRWNDDKGYEATNNQFGEFVVDSGGRRPGIYTVLGGPPNEWVKEKIDRNLKEIADSSAYDSSEFDPASIMMYNFEEWMYIRGNESRCYVPAPKNELSALDKAGAGRSYPWPAAAKSAVLNERSIILQRVLQIKEFPKARINLFERDLQLLQTIE